MTASRRLLILMLAFGLLAILAASLYQRFANPSLTVSRISGAGQPQNGMAVIGQLMEQAAANPRDQELLLRLVEQLMAIGQWQSAENFAQRALALDPENSPNGRAMYLLAVIHHNQGRHKEAAELLEKLLAKDENPSARYSLGVLYLHFLHEPQAGIAQLEKGLQVHSLSPSLAAAMQEELTKAKAAFPAPAKPVESGQTGETGAESTQLHKE